MKKILKVLLSLVLAFLLLIGGYVLYMQLKYYRIEDNQALVVQNNLSQGLDTDTEYTALSYNIGFGAYSPEYSFFMDKGSMKGQKLQNGKYGKAISKEDVQKNTKGSIEQIKAQNVDFVLLQEVDTDASRSYQVNQYEEIKNSLADYSSSFAINFHSPYLFFPLHDPHGYVNAGLMTLSKYAVNTAYRKSLPIDESFITKFTDLDRCMAISKIDVNNGKQLVLINAHLSAYDEGGVVRSQQLSVLNGIIESEYKNGNYVIVAGDFNHSLLDSAGIYPTEQDIPDWVFVLNNELLPDFASIVRADNITEVATCRSCDIPYTKGVNYTATLDGFIITNNIEAKALNIDNDFMYSDHNPVKLSFKLLN